MAIAVKDMNTYLNSYLYDIQFKNKNKTILNRTISNYESGINLFIRFLEDSKYSELTPENVDKVLFEYRNFMRNSLNNIKSTVNSKLTITSTFLNNINVKSAIGINEYERVIPPLFELNVASENEKENNFDEDFHKIKCLEIHEVEEIVDLIPDTKMCDKAILETLLHTGLRVSELVALNKNDIQVALDQKGCFIPPENYHKAIPVYVRKSTTKGKRHARITYMDYDTLRLLNKMIRERIT